MFRILRDERGATSLEVFIIMACFIVIAVIASLAMFAQGGQDTEDIAEAIATIESEVEIYIEEDLAEDLQQASEDVEVMKREACEYLCEVDYNAGVYNVVQYNNCLSNCSQ